MQTDSADLGAALLLRLPSLLKEQITRVAREHDRTTVGEIRAVLRAHVSRESREPASDRTAARSVAR
jgi:plasmid stability protein